MKRFGATAIAVGLGCAVMSVAQAKPAQSIEDYCYAHQTDPSSASWRFCVGDTYVKVFHRLEGRCSKTECRYSLKRTSVTDVGNAVWTGYGFRLNTVIKKDPKYGSLGYNGTLLDPHGQVTHFFQSCGAECNYPAEWQSGAHKGAAYRDVGSSVFLTIPR